MTANAKPDIHHIDSRIATGAQITYKETCLCETTPGVRSFSGYVRLPWSLIADVGGAVPYDANMFFWYFESRNDPRNAPLALYVGGGPGTTALGGVTAENGPCTINPDSNSTTHNPWSWNNNVNMLYVDQPNGVGFSYDETVASTLDLLTGTITPINGSFDGVQTNATFVKGMLPSQNVGAAANTTMNAAKIMWLFTQVWLQDFPKHKSSDDRISVWSNSYGGHWAPGLAAHFESQNRLLRNCTLTSPLRNATLLHLDTLGITNGCIDAKIEAPLYPEMAFNNTYGLQTITGDAYNASLTNHTKPGGCNDLITQCRTLALADSENTGTNTTINSACALASQYCFAFVQGAYTATSGRSAFDISRTALSVFPADYIIGYLNQDWVRAELGVPVNFTISADYIVDTFFGVTGDAAKVSIETLDYVAQSGVKVALVHGDRDYRCNWLGGEAVSLALQHSSTSQFRAAGYANITTNSSYTGGVVRQHNGISFSRVFEAGHAVGAFQPETVSKIFDRVMFDKDVATGEVSGKNYTSTGPTSSFGIKNVLPEGVGSECYTWAAPITCREEQIGALVNGTAEVEDFIVRKP
ncbi:Alpha/Beta hydrolase protein [Lophiotrema nucula]|uniref:Alpha/Beta hydrolase protein n=1 Tax=Lophiotrema nucula TaxID=690887 RepID=A0A6A5YGT6_9PLEO|nr:Alpha/Beta hydrolase protein [Lophiotrema nucula]